jgi:hypothetical protein
MHEVELFVMKLPNMAICMSGSPFYNDQFAINRITPGIYSISLEETTQHA